MSYIMVDVERFVPEALAVSGHSREETLAFEEPVKVMDSTGCLFAGTFITSPAAIHLGIARRTWAAFIKDW